MELLAERSARQKARDRNVALVAVILYNTNRDPARTPALHLEELMPWMHED